MASNVRQRLERLRRLGLHRGTGHLPSHDEGTPTEFWPAHRIAPSPLETTVPGRVVESPLGACYLVEEARPTTLARGGYPLAECLQLSGEMVARLDNNPTLHHFDFRRAAFIDTETSGLDLGTGTYAFLIGVGTFEGERFILRQYLLRDPSEEAAALHLLARQMETCDSLVTFNGRHFDIPLLNTRYALNRQRSPFPHTPHLDLLPPARRLWRERLPSRALGDLERNILGHQRTQADVPGWLIPQIYLNYVRSGDARDLARVFYHNMEDIISMVSLATHLTRAFSGAPEQREAREAMMLGRWYELRGQLDEAERAYRTALAGSLPPTLRQRVLRDLGFLLKRMARREEAKEIWEAWLASAEAIHDLTPYIELAKHYEWHEANWEVAHAWTLRAIAQAQRWSHTPQRAAALAALEHRLARLARKLAG